MGFVAWALLGMVLGAAGTELLRARKPDLVGKVEHAARRLVGSLRSSDSADAEAREAKGSSVGAKERERKGDGHE